MRGASLGSGAAAAEYIAARRAAGGGGSGVGGGESFSTSSYTHFPFSEPPDTSTGILSSIQDVDFAIGSPTSDIGGAPGIVVEYPPITVCFYNSFGGSRTSLWHL